MDKGAWRVIVYGITNESDRTEATEHTHEHAHTKFKTIFPPKVPLSFGNPNGPRTANIIYTTFTRFLPVSTAFLDLTKTEPFNLMFIHTGSHKYTLF